jgi:hypothetical protein
MTSESAILGDSLTVEVLVSVSAEGLATGLGLVGFTKIDETDSDANRKTSVLNKVMRLDEVGCIPSD